MYEFNKNEIDFLKRFGQTANGKELLNLFEKIKIKADSASSIPAGADYGAQVEGRRLVNELLSKITDTMNQKERKSSGKQDGVDEFY